MKERFSGLSEVYLDLCKKACFLKNIFGDGIHEVI
jgi:hypothetical protein